MELKIDHLSKRFNETCAVNDISVTFEPGVFGLLGANGAGKTTLMRMICGILNPSAGQILFNGKNIARLNEEYRNLIGYLPQDFGYYPDFTAKEYLRFIAAVKGISKEEVKRKIPYMLETVSLLDVADKKIRTFSGGMKQRLGIAQAIINNPIILILDEPTAGLDPKERIKFRNLISGMSKDRIVILSTHIVSDVDYIANMLLIIKNGNLIINSDTQTAIRSMDGKVWECRLPQKQIDEINHRFRVVNIHHNTGENASLRIISDDCPCIGATNIEPTLEDLYMHHFQEADREEQTV